MALGSIEGVIRTGWPHNYLRTWTNVPPFPPRTPIPITLSPFLLRLPSLQSRRPSVVLTCTDVNPPEPGWPGVRIIRPDEVSISICCMVLQEAGTSKLVDSTGRPCIQKQHRCTVVNFTRVLWLMKNNTKIRSLIYSLIFI